MDILKHRLLFRKDRRIGSARHKRHYDLPLTKGGGTGFLTILIALMTFLALMAIGVSFSLSAISERWSSGLENKVTIEIPAENKNSELRSAETIRRLTQDVQKALNKNPAVKSVSVMADEEIQALISPWLGEDMILHDIPLPGLIAVELEKMTPDRTAEIEKSLLEIDQSIRLDTHEGWLEDLLRFTHALQIAAVLILLVIGVTTVIAVAGAVRARMAIHSEDVELLHLMGASDEYVTRQFQHHALIIALKGGCIGTLAGLVLLAGLGVLMGSAAPGLIPDMHFSTGFILALAFLPGLICLIAILSARYTVLRVLSLMP